MPRRTALLFLLTFTSFLGAKTLPPDTNTSESVTTIKGWGHVIDPDSDCTIRATPTGDSVSITIPESAHDYAAELHRWNAPRVLTKIKGDFIAEVQITGEFSPGDQSTIDNRKSYNGAGLLLVADPQNHLSLQRAAFRTDDGHVRHYLNLELRQDGRSITSQYSMDLKDRDTYLRLERHDTHITASVSQDGLQWRSYPPLDTNLPDKLHIGIESISSSNTPFTSTFTHFSLYHRTNSSPTSTDNASSQSAAAR
ncbi:MAG TPA: DUF1349 domain-containing protein [Tepidisphaeraceae bacterium]|jgi:regulation of enolase protein 1 (concanavalin A-like superfamily)|nr:DUF1349 domain-containing protein [Tepidisphaeraceae bacterium]